MGSAYSPHQGGGQRQGSSAGVNAMLSQAMQDSAQYSMGGYDEGGSAPGAQYTGGVQANNQHRSRVGMLDPDLMEDDGEVSFVIFN